MYLIYVVYFPVKYVAALHLFRRLIQINTRMGTCPSLNSARHPLSCRYMSPTDALVSPVTRGLLARNRRPMRIVNPWGPPKVQILVSENSDVFLSQMEGCSNDIEMRVDCKSCRLSPSRTS